MLSVLSLINKVDKRNDNRDNEDNGEVPTWRFVIEKTDDMDKEEMVIVIEKRKLRFSSCLCCQCCR